LLHLLTAGFGTKRTFLPRARRCLLIGGKADLEQTSPNDGVRLLTDLGSNSSRKKKAGTEAGADWVVVVSSLCRQSFSTPSARRNAHALLEGPIEGRLGLVTDVSCHLRDADPLPLE